MRSALIGWSGFVGGNLDRQHGFDDRFRSSDIERVGGTSWDLVVCAGLPAEKWRINRDPESDLANAMRLQGALGTADIRELIVISTIDVYPRPIDVSEATPIDPATCHPYGRHRLAFERWAQAQFKTTVVRLPGLFGPGLKKNVVFDLLHGNRLDLVHAEGQFQFYALDRLWRDIQVVRRESIPVANLVTEPVSVRDVARVLTGVEFTSSPPGQPPRYDVHTDHATALGGSGPYLTSSMEVLDDLGRFAAIERRSGRLPEAGQS
ncbi:MAG: NAD-dependent epimerase/dehydratase family protein [Chloroflexota bacterium]